MHITGIMPVQLLISLVTLQFSAQISLTTWIPWPFPDFVPFPCPLQDFLTFPGFQKFQKNGNPDTTASATETELHCRGSVAHADFIHWCRQVCTLLSFHQQIYHGTIHESFVACGATKRLWVWLVQRPRRSTLRNDYRQVVHTWITYYRHNGVKAPAPHLCSGGTLYFALIHEYIHAVSYTHLTLPTIYSV